jgi:NitT/TauT family transport system ATP-binding protein
VLKLENISHGYGDQRILENVSLTLEAGQRLALMGPSGCGKTTLLRIALGLLTPDRGRVENTFAGTAAVFQEPRLLPWATALENVNLVLSDHKTTLLKAEKYLELVGLKEARDKFPRELSGGMQQRVSLARALAVEGDCLILDEPFKAMDEALRQQIMALVKERNAAILLVTHDEEEAAALGCEILHFADLT